MAIFYGRALSAMATLEGTSASRNSFGVAMFAGRGTTAGGPCPLDMGDAMTCPEKSKLKTNVARLWNNRVPPPLKRWVTQPLPHGRGSARGAMATLLGTPVFRDGFGVAMFVGKNYGFRHSIIAHASVGMASGTSIPHHWKGWSTGSLCGLIECVLCPIDLGAYLRQFVRSETPHLVCPVVTLEVQSHRPVEVA